MTKKNLRRFFISIILPSILAIALYVLSIFVFILPSFEKNMMTVKKEMVKELTATVWSLVDEYKMEADKGGAEDSLKTAVLDHIEELRYGSEGKDYFWIIDEHPYMLMHPYRTELIGKDLNTFKDEEGKLLFVEAARLVSREQEGYINYLWQWKDDSTRVVPKLSYVKGYPGWGWIIGTGIYLDDVHREIAILKNRLLRIALLITFVISILLVFIIRQSLIIEEKRQMAEQNLRLSRRKYKSLIDASTEGTLLVVENEVTYSNMKFSRLSGYDQFELRAINLDSVLNVKLSKLLHQVKDPKQSVAQETILLCKDGTEKDVLLNLSLINIASRRGIIITLKEVSPKRQYTKDKEVLSHDLLDSLLLMNRPLHTIKNEIRICESTDSIQEVAMRMSRKGRNILFVMNKSDIIGVITTSDLKKRVVARGLSLSLPAREIMTSPIVSIKENALLYEAMLLMNREEISHVALKNTGDVITGVIGVEDIIDIQQNTVSYLIREIENADHVSHLGRLYKRLLVLVKTLTDSGDKIENVSRIITSVNDAIHSRIIGLALEDRESPPCRFAFVVLGSEGRREQTLETDQDNAIIIEDVPEDMLSCVSSYFQGLGERVNSDLNAVGLKYCKGEVMARNPRWSQPLSVWKGYFSDWIESGSPQGILDASIFFDFRKIYGADYLVDDLRDHVHRVSDNRAAFFHHMAQGVLKFRPAQNIFGNIVVGEGSADEVLFDIKKAIFPVVAMLRVYSIRDKIVETNSLERARKLYMNKSIQKSDYDYLVESFSYMTRLRLRFQAGRILDNEIAGNAIDLSSLSGIELSTLKKILSEIHELQNRVSIDFRLE